MKRFTILALTGTLLISILAVGRIRTSLNIIPHDTTGLVYAHSLKDLNKEVTDLISEMNPATAPNQDIVANVLSDIFEGGFESLADLEKYGFDLEQDFALYIHQIPSETEPVLSATVRIADQETVLQMIKTESGEMQSIDYNGVNYLKTIEESACFSFLDDVMIYSEHYEICEKTIDVYQKKAPSILEKHSFANSFDLDDASNDLVGFVDRPLFPDSSELAGIQLLLERSTAGNMSSIFAFFDQIQSVTLTVQHNTGEFLITPAIQFVPDSEIGNLFSPPKNDFSEILKFLPEQSSLNVGATAELYKYLSNFGMRQLAQVNSLQPDNREAKNIQLLFEDLEQSVEEFLHFVDGTIGMTMNVSGSFVPDQTFVFKVSDETKIIASLEEQLKKLDVFLQAVGVSDTYVASTNNDTEVYEGVEIRKFNYNNLLTSMLDSDLNPDASDFMPPELQNLMPDNYYYYYGIANGFLVGSAAGTSSSIKSMIDRIFGFENGFDQSDGYTRIMDKLDAGGDMILALSPVTLINQIIQLIASSGNPNVGMMSVMFANMPQTYSVGTSMFNNNNIIKLRFFVSLLDLKDLYTVISAIMPQISGQTFQ